MHKGCIVVPKKLPVESVDEKWGSVIIIRKGDPLKISRVNSGLVKFYDYHGHFHIDQFKLQSC